MFKPLLTTTAGVHKQKLLFTCVDRHEILAWALSESSLRELQSKPIKLALRLALLNSNSVATLSTLNYVIKPDITVGGQLTSTPEFILTDGCGRISFNFAQQIYNHFRENESKITKPELSRQVQYNNDGTHQYELDKHNSSYLHVNGRDSTPPSAYQIRFGGFKGMLVVANPTNDVSNDRMQQYGMENFDIVFVKSMDKFQTPDLEQHRTVELLGMSLPSPVVYLNSEMLDILSGRSVDSAELLAFLTGLADSYLERHSFLLTDTDKSVQFAILNKDSIALRMITAGFALKHVYLCSFFRETVMPLKFPIVEAVRLYGVADYSNTLQPGEVVVINNGKYVEGVVLLFKEPCFSGADLQKFRAMSKFECNVDLHHLDNVIVFSTNGFRSDSSRMAGSDLDGDKYVCIWNKFLVENSNADIEPGNKFCCFDHIALS